MQMREKVGKSQNTVFFPMIWGSGGSKSRLAKAAGAEPAGQMRDKKLHAVVARSTFASQNVQDTWVSEHFWKLRCRKSARRCGAKHISKSKCTKHTRCGPLLAVEMSKKCTPLWREANFEVKSAKKLRGSEHFWTFRCRFAWQAQWIVHRVKSEQNVRVLCHFQLQPPLHHTYTPIRYTLLRSTTLHIHYTLYYTTLTLHYTTFHYATLHYTTLHYTTLHYITLHYTPQRYTTLHYTTLPPLHFTTLHYTTLHNTTTTTTLHYTPLHSATLHYTPLHSTTLHYTPLHSTTLNHTPLH